MVAVTDETKMALIVMGCCGFMAIVLMGLRLFMRKFRGQKFELSDYLTMIAIFCVICRLSFTSVVLVYGNNNISAAVRASHTFTDEEIYQKTVGSKLAIANRGVYNLYLWLQKSVVLLLYRRMLAGLPWPRRIIQAYWIILLVTHVALQISTYVECQPFYLYWQVVPDPGSCVYAVAELYTLVVTNIMTDIMLILLPMPYIFRIKRSFNLRLQLFGLFSLGVGLIVIAVCRLPVWGPTTSQINRDTLGPIEGFISAFVANIPTLFALRNQRAPGSTLNTRKSSQAGTSGSTQDSYARDKFRQIPSMKDHQIMVTHDIEMVSNKESVKEDVDSHQLPPDHDSVEELIR